MANIRSIAVPVHVDGPFTAQTWRNLFTMARAVEISEGQSLVAQFAQVRVTRADVFHLQVLQLTVDVEAVGRLYETQTTLLQQISLLTVHGHAQSPLLLRGQGAKQARVQRRLRTILCIAAGGVTPASVGDSSPQHMRQRSGIMVHAVGEHHNP
eukprot:SAG31_NODE_1372_length_8604_cov_9.561082_6_plen_154_part_00